MKAPDMERLKQGDTVYWYNDSGPATRGKVIETFFTGVTIKWEDDETPRPLAFDHGQRVMRLP